MCFVYSTHRMNFGSTNIFNLPDGTIDAFEFPNIPEMTNPINNQPASPKPEPCFFKTKRGIFKAVLTPQPFGYTVKVGGRSYLDCINISITLQNGIVTKAKLGHIQSEPECGFGTLLENGETVDFIKGALQFCKEKFPSLHTIEFDDMSTIDCGISKDKEPPRRPEKPFSLPHFSIARTGKTWYENRFGAKLIDSQLYTKYRSAVDALHAPIGISFETFCETAQITNEQASILHTLYSLNHTWISFFNAIPKSKQCAALYNWLPSFITDLIQNRFMHYGWSIDIDTFEKVAFELVDEPALRGGKRAEKTRRIRGRRGVRFSNQ
jgi:hypothetical protein